MRPAVLVCPGARYVPRIEDAVYIGVDAGYKILEQMGITPDFACGDFDSVDLENAEIDVPYSRHPVCKNESDTELAIMLADEHGCSPIYVCGGLGGRVDHEFANLRLVMYRRETIILLDEKQRVFRAEKGRHRFDGSWKHISFFAIGEAEISLEGFDYPLDHRLITNRDIYTLSNSIQGREGWLRVHAGAVLCMESDLK